MSYFFSDTECFTFASHVSNMIAYGNAVILYIEGMNKHPSIFIIFLLVSDPAFAT